MLSENLPSLAEYPDFRGERTQKIDAKGRVSVPYRFRNALIAGDPECESEQTNENTDTNTDTKNDGKPCPRLVLVQGFKSQTCLHCYSLSKARHYSWKAYVMPRTEPLREKLLMVFNESAYETSLDDVGRIIIPDRLRTRFGIQKEQTETVHFVGRGEIFEIWQPQAYYEQQAHRFDNEESDYTQSL